MFKCGFCKQTSQPRDPRRTIITETRKREYILGYEDEDKRLPIVSRGSEIVQETPACPACYVIQMGLKGIIDDHRTAPAVP